MDLNLGDYLSDEELRHYQRFLGGTKIITFVHPDADQPWRWTATAVQADQPAPEQRAAIAAAEQRPTTDGLLVKHGWGPDTCSSSQELALSPGWSWDVCFYYRRLGLHWRATRKEIREALHKLGALTGGGNADLTYAAHQLLDEEIRRRYDRVPLGQLFLEDKDTEEMLKRAAHAAASAMAARGRPGITPEDVLGDWGFSTGPRGGPQGEERGQQAPFAPLPPPLGRLASYWELKWSWYTEPEMAPMWRASELETWQLLLVREFAARGIRARFAVGLCEAENFRVQPAPDQRIVVILLGRGGPTPEKATEAIEMWGLAQEI